MAFSEHHRQRFLAKLTGPKGYKRYTGLPLRYAGGKTLAVGHVIERLPAGLEHLASPFFGGGSVEFAAAKELGIRVSGYDVFDLLVNYWQHQIADPAGLAGRIGELGPCTRDSFWANRAVAKDHWEGGAQITDAVELAARFWYCHNLSYGPGFPGWISSNFLDARTFATALAKVRDFQAWNVAVHCRDFADSLEAHRDDFLYLDPVYYMGPGSKMFKGIYPSRNWPSHHDGFDHEKLRDLLRQHRGGFVMSYNDCPAIREWYADCRIEEVAWMYSMGQGETRIGRNRQAANSIVKQSHELLISRDAC